MPVQRKTFDDGERGTWKAAPLVGVGPLRFGMRHEEVAHAVRETMRTSDSLHEASGRVLRAEFIRCNSNPLRPDFSFSAYYDNNEALAAVAVDAQSGPQVVLDELRLVGRVPSELEAQLMEYAECHRFAVNYSEYWDPSVEPLGILMRVQRVNDMVLSRPNFVCEAWAEGCADSSGTKIPRAEWRKR